MIICNLYGQPGAGKSTVRADVFRLLKQKGVRCEEVVEFAKSCVWQGRFSALNCQPYVFGQQLYATQLLEGQVDVVITDSPMLLCRYYASLQNRVADSFYEFVSDTSLAFDNMDFFLLPVGRYDEAGRMQNSEEANLVGEGIRAMLDDHEISYMELLGDVSAGPIIAESILKRLDN